MFKKILVPVDGSGACERIAGWTTSLARAIGAEVVLLSVIDPGRVATPDRAPFTARTEEARARAFAGAPRGTETGAVSVQAAGFGAASVPREGGPPEMAPATGTQLIENAVAAADSYLVRQAHRLATDKVRVTTKVVVGSPAEQIVVQAGELGAHLIAMATHRESPVARGILGSVTDRVLHSTDLPVLAVHPKGPAVPGGELVPPKVVFVPLDGSEFSAAVVPLAIEVAAALGARVEFLSVVWRYYGAGWPDAEWTEPDRGGPDFRQEVFRYLDRFVEQATSRGVVAHARAMFGNPAARIIDESGSVESALIVMSTRGASGFARWALGSVTDKVIRSSGHPVLAVPPPK